jgi:hypothetical protein
MGFGMVFTVGVLMSVGAHMGGRRVVARAPQEVREQAGTVPFSGEALEGGAHASKLSLKAMQPREARAASCPDALRPHLHARFRAAPPAPFHPTSTLPYPSPPSHSSLPSAPLPPTPCSSSTRTSWPSSTLATWPRLVSRRRAGASSSTSGSTVPTPPRQQQARGAAAGQGRHHHHHQQQQEQREQQQAQQA